MAAITVHQEPHVLMYQVHFNVLVNLDTLEMEYIATVGSSTFSIIKWY